MSLFCAYGIALNISLREHSLPQRALGTEQANKKDPIPMISIFVAHFGPAQILENKYIVPIQVGKALARDNLGILGDDSGDNISSKNPEFCELTAQYWVWKNCKDSEYYGLFHYRRFLDLTFRSDREIDAHGLVVEPRAGTSFFDDYGLNEGDVARAVAGVDIIIPRPFDVKQTGNENVFEQYSTAPFHHAEHLKTVRDVITERHPGFRIYFDKAMNGRLLYPNNMFVFKRDIFHQYSEWLFDILFELERRIDVSNMKWQEKRAIGYIAERLLTVYILKLLDDKAVKAKEANRVFIADASLPPVGPDLPVSDLPIISIAASTDEMYVQHMAALVASTFATASKEHFIDFMILDGGVNSRDRVRLSELTKLHPHCRLTFIDMSRQHLDLPTNSYFTRGTFYRLSLPELLPNRRKVLFLDTDVVVRRDVASLFDLELGEYFVAAVKDIIMKSFVGLGVASIAETGSIRAGRYLADRLDLNDPSAYFQAGVLLLNLEELRRCSLSTKMTHALRTERFWFLDQDVLNKFMAGKVMYIDGRWNSVQMDDYHLAALNAVERQVYELTLDDPWIIHYAGVFKPWKRTGHPHGARYWAALRNTTWYEEALFSYLESLSRAKTSSASLSNHTLYRKSVSLWLARRVWRSLPLSVRKRLGPVADSVKRRVALEA
jgi:lipopolysaccharide biosynthesis glycosyltransferase